MQLLITLVRPEPRVRKVCGGVDVEKTPCEGEVSAIGRCSVRGREQARALTLIEVYVSHEAKNRGVSMWEDSASPGQHLPPQCWYSTLFSERFSKLYFQGDFMDSKRN